MKKLLRAISIAVLGVGLSAGIVSANSGDVSNTGPGSDNVIRFEGDERTTVDSRNNADVTNRNTQNADSGDAEVRGNTNGGSADSGGASNDNSTDTSVSQSNSGATSAAMSGSGSGSHSASIDNTGPDSNNRVIFNETRTTRVDSRNNSSVTNNSNQTANSGDATVQNNTNAGDASTGDASNSNDTSTSVDQSN